jgi:hypothetical protein
MDKFTDIYIKSIINEEVEPEDILQNSTELLDEEQCNLIGESFGNWLKSFWKTGSSKNKMLLKLIMEFANKYKFKSVNDDPNYLGKREGGYNIYLNIKEDNLKSNQVILMVQSTKTGKSIIPATKFRVKYSWTLEELTEEINNILLDARIKLTTAPGTIESKSENKQQSSSDNSLSAIDGLGGFEYDEIKGKLNNEKGSKERKLSVLKKFISGWKKLSEEEQKFFEKLK